MKRKGKSGNVQPGDVGGEGWGGGLGAEDWGASKKKPLKFKSWNARGSAKRGGGRDFP